MTPTASASIGKTLYPFLPSLFPLCSPMPAFTGGVGGAGAGHQNTSGREFPECRQGLLWGGAWGELPDTRGWWLQDARGVEEGGAQKRD